MLLLLQLYIAINKGFVGEMYCIAIILRNTLQTYLGNTQGTGGGLGGGGIAYIAQ